MTIFKTDRSTAYVVPWLISVLTILCLPNFVTAQVFDDFETGGFNLVNSVFDSDIQVGLPSIHCISTERSFVMHVNGNISTADLNLGSVDDQVVMVWGNNGGRLEIDYDPSVTDLTFGGNYNAILVRLSVAEPAGSIEVVLLDGAGIQFLVSQTIGGSGDYIFPLSDFVGVDVFNCEFIELNLVVPDFGDYNISDFRPAEIGNAAAAIDVTQDTAEGPPYPAEELIMTLFDRDPVGDLVPMEVFECSLFEVTNGAEPPAIQMIAMDSGNGVGMPGEQVAIAVNDLGTEPPGHRTFDLHFHAASVDPTIVNLPFIPEIMQPPDPLMPTSFGLGFKTYQNDRDGGILRRAKHWLSFETPDGSGLSFSNLSLMLGDPETHPNSFHIFFDVDTNGGPATAKAAGPLFEMLLRAQILHYPSGPSGVSPRADIGSLGPNVPNPFNPKTEIRFNLPRSLPVWLTVHDLAGREVQVLADGQVMKAGQNGIFWDGRDHSGRQSPSGSYFVKFEAGDERSVRKIMLLK
jgi:hypothetical protein